MKNSLIHIPRKPVLMMCEYEQVQESQEGLMVSFWYPPSLLDSFLLYPIHPSVMILINLDW
jgi:hypothetical protein